MRVAVISDIHANLHALEAVLASLDDEEVDALWCLGDTVGYGARPNECCRLVRDRAAMCLVGNHDLVVLGHIGIEWFAGDAAAAAAWTRTVLDEPSRDFLAPLEPAGEAEGFALFHGSPRDPVWDYVLNAEAARASLLAVDSPVVLVGHSHVALALSLDGDRLAGGVAPGGLQVDLAEGRWLLNPGSVGQPRDGDPRAAYLVLDTDARRAAFRRVEYPIARTQAEIREAALPELLAARLQHGS